MSTTERDYYELLGVPADRRRAGDQEGLPPACARAPSRTSPTRPTPRCGSARSPRPTRRSRTPRPGSSTIATATRGSAPAGSSRATSTSATSATSSARSSARTCSGRPPPRRRRLARAPTSLAEVEIELVDAARTGSRSRCRSRRRRHLQRPATASGAAPGSAVGRLPALRRARRAPAGLARDPRRVRPPGACPDCNGSGRKVEHAVRDLQRRRTDGRGRATLDVEIPAGHPRRPADPHHGRGARRDARRPRGRRLRPGPRPPRRAVRARGQRHLLAGRPHDRPGLARGEGRRSRPRRAPQELEFDPGTQPGEVRVLRGKGMPVLQGFGRGDHRVLVNVTVPRRLTAEQRRLLEEFEQLSDEDTYQHQQGLLREARRARSSDPGRRHRAGGRAEELRARFVELAPEGFEEADGGRSSSSRPTGAAAERVLAAVPGCL